MTRVLVDTSVWVRHFRRGDTHLQALLASDAVLCHPLVLIELACGTPPSPLITRGARLWTDDRALRVQAERLGVAYAPPSH